MLAMRRTRSARLAAAIVATVAAACMTASASAALVFPAKTPSWIVKATTRTATGLGDPSATVAFVSLGRFPIVVIKGDFVCNACSRPSNAVPAPTGHYAAVRFDAVTHQGTDFGLSNTYGGATSSLCNGSDCVASTTYLDSALRALDAHSRGLSEPFDHRFGSSHCKIRLPVPEYRWVWGHCSVALEKTSRSVLVSFRERWNGLDPSGKRYAADSPRHHHLFTVLESRAGFVTRFNSTGDWPPQWRR